MTEKYYGRNGRNLTKQSSSAEPNKLRETDEGAFTDFLQKVEQFVAERNKPGEIKITVEGWDHDQGKTPIVEDGIKEFLLFVDQGDHIMFRGTASRIFMKDVVKKLKEILAKGSREE